MTPALNCVCMLVPYGETVSLLTLCFYQPGGINQPLCFTLEALSGEVCHAFIPYTAGGSWACTAGGQYASGWETEGECIYTRRGRWGLTPPYSYCSGAIPCLSHNHNAAMHLTRYPANGYQQTRQSKVPFPRQNDIATRPFGLESQGGSGMRCGAVVRCGDVLGSLATPKVPLGHFVCMPPRKDSTERLFCFGRLSPVLSNSRWRARFSSNVA